MKRNNNKKDLIRLRQISSFASSRIILTANNYRMFDHLEGKGKSDLELSKAVETDHRATGLLLNSLVAIGLLQKQKNKYINTPIASRYLVGGMPDYQGDILRHYNTLWNSWSGLDSVLKTGLPNRTKRNHESFILGMHNLALLKVKNVINNINLTGVKRLLDLGGGPGTYSMAFAGRKIEAVIMDFPETLNIARRLVDQAGLSSKVKFLTGDFTTDDIGKNYDMIFISQIFHAYDESTCLSMFKKSYGALNASGKVVVQEFYLDETRTQPLQGALFAINMLVNTSGGRTYTAKEMCSWMKKTGFIKIERKILDDTILLCGTKGIR